MAISDANINGTAPFAAVSLGSRFFSVGARLVAFFGLGGGIDGALDNGRSGLGLNLGNCLGGSFLRHGGRNGRGGQRRHLHNDLDQNPLSIARMLRVVNEEFVNHSALNMILGKSRQIDLTDNGFLTAGVSR